jgi:hypothetical protein
VILGAFKRTFSTELVSHAIVGAAGTLLAALGIYSQSGPVAVALLVLWLAVAIGAYRVRYKRF